MLNDSETMTDVNGPCSYAALSKQVSLFLSSYPTLHIRFEDLGQKNDLLTNSRSKPLWKI